MYAKEWLMCNLQKHCSKIKKLMLTPRLTHCTDCVDIIGLIDDIDCRLTENSKKMYNSLIYMFTCSVNPEVMADLLNYRRILVHRYCNPNYGGGISIDLIASKVKLLIHK